MKKHRFKITLEHLEDPEGGPHHETPLVFHIENHDDIIALAERIGCLSNSDRAFLVGMKLLGEVPLEDRCNPLSSDFVPHFGKFVKPVKQSSNDPG